MGRVVDVVVGHWTFARESQLEDGPLKPLPPRVLPTGEVKKAPAPWVKRHEQLDAGERVQWMQGIGAPAPRSSSDGVLSLLRPQGSPIVR